MAYEVAVEIAWTPGYGSLGGRAWYDITPYVEGGDAIEITHGRGDGFSTVEPASCRLTLDNRDGRFTPGNTSSPLYPSVKLGRALRVIARDTTVAGNALISEVSTAEPTNSANFWQTYTVGYGYGATQATKARSTAQAQAGTASLLVTWPTVAAGQCAVAYPVSLVVGRTYTLSAYVYVPAGSPAVRLAFGSAATSTASAVTGSWQRLSVTWTADSPTTGVCIVNSGAATAGQTVYVDSVMLDEGSTLRAFTSSGGPVSWRFAGLVEEWAVDFADGTPNASRVSVTAASPMARLAAGNELRSVIEEESLLDDPLCHYPLGEAAGSTRAGNISTHVQPSLTVRQVGSGGTLEFGEGIGPPTDGLSAPILTRASSGNGKYLGATLHAGTSGLYFVVAEVWFNTSTAGPMTLMELSTAGGDARLSLYVTAAGKLAIRADNAGSVVTVTGTTTVTDGLTHHARVVLDVVAYMHVYCDGVDEGSAVMPYSTAPNFTRVTVGGAAAATTYSDVFNGTLAHAAVYASMDEQTSSRMLSRYTAGSSGFAGELSSAAILRLMGYAQWMDGAAFTGSAVMSAVDTTGQQALELMRGVTLTEGGLLYDSPTGTLTFQSRSIRYNPTVDLTLDCAKHEVEAALLPVLDASTLVNDVTATRPGGPAYRSVDAASVAEYGPRRQALELWTTSDADVEAAAAWVTSRYSTPAVRIPTVSTDVLAVSSPGSLLGLQLSSVIRLANVPAQVGPATIDLFVEGWSESITGTSWMVTFNTSSADGWSAWQLDSATLSVLGTTTTLAY